MGFFAWIQATAGSFVPWVYPALCELCGGILPCEEHAWVACAGPRCPRCARRLPEGVAGGHTCADCRTAPSGLAQVIALGSYFQRAPLAPWILSFKHGGRPDLAFPLGARLAERLLDQAQLGPGGLLVPVPLHLWRRLGRGYDQAALLAREAAVRSGWDWGPALHRTRATPAQGSLHSRGRGVNVQGAFRVHPEWEGRVRGRDVYLVDDVYTTGATLRACATVLRRAGARRVGALVLGRAERAP
ncbi:MAG: ComF family protein [Planctomycetes bacterium]|nr:ComF family protein [Planctomycetota bacterium]